VPGKRKTKRRSPQNVPRLPDLDDAKASVFGNETLTANLSPPMLSKYWLQRILVAYDCHP
jgi:hypothetical protein